MHFSWVKRGLVEHHDSTGNSPHETTLPIFQWFLDGLSFKLSLAIHPMVFNLLPEATPTACLIALFFHFNIYIFFQASQPINPFLKILVKS